MSNFINFTVSTTLLLFSPQILAKQKPHDHVNNHQSRHQLAEKVHLTRCGGVLKIVDFPRFTRLKFKNIRNCNRIKVEGISYHLAQNHHRKKKLVIDHPKRFYNDPLKIKVFHSRRQLKDKFVVRPKRLKDHRSRSVHLSQTGEVSRLRGCGGSVKLKESRHWFVLDIRGNRFCSKAFFPGGKGHKHLAFGNRNVVKIPKSAYQDRYAVHLENGHGVRSQTVIIHEPFGTYL